MLTEWSIAGFKSIRSATGIPLSPITIFAGANSSGKSTFLQSILLLKQTVQYGPKNRPLSLNGPLLRLGTLDDVVCATSDNQEISISFKITVPSHTSYAPWMKRGARLAYMTDSTQLNEITASMAWRPRKPQEGQSPAAAKLQTEIRSGHLNVTRTTDKAITRDYYIKYNKNPDTELYQASLDAASEADVFQDRAESYIEGVYISHFLPDWVQVCYNSEKQRARDISEAIFRTKSVFGNSDVDSEIVPDSVVQIVNQWLVEKDRPPIDQQDITVGELIDVMQPVLINPRPNMLLTSLTPSRVPEVAELRERIEIALLAEVKESDENWDTDIGSPRAVTQGANFIVEYLKLGVRYLGPLRNEPRPVYPLEALENTTDVGYRGEHTAAVLELNGSTNIKYIPSSTFNDDLPRFATIRSTLREAVVDWLAYMGVADDVVAQEEGVFGNSLRVTTSGLSQHHDLTNVGVGVSQVLPIIVSCLLAPASSLLIFEQPELHLHPRVQARLADFFLSIAIGGRQCILETHSEYLIERFRRRIAESDSQKVENILGVYFVERENGESQFHPVRVSKYGAIENWPKDFFDQSQIETSGIISAASRKRKRERERDPK